MGSKMNNYLWIVWHQISDILRIIGMRDRFRCPECGAVGTWKPHGGWLDDSTASGRRWICKWCGLYIGRPMGGKIVKRRAFIDPELKCWRIQDFYKSEDLPDGAYIPKNVIKANPFIG
jgi:hypothetical protein